MGIKIAGINVSKIIKKEIGDNTLKDPAHVVSLINFTRGTRTGNNTGGTNPTSVATPGKGFIDTTERQTVKGTLVVAGDVIIQLVGDSLVAAAGGLAVPTVDDHAAAMYTCLCRGV
jgi:hypothetical protein